MSDRYRLEPLGDGQDWQGGPVPERDEAELLAPALVGWAGPMRAVREDLIFRAIEEALRRQVAAYGAISSWQVEAASRAVQKRLTEPLTPKED